MFKVTVLVLSASCSIASVGAGEIGRDAGSSVNPTRQQTMAGMHGDRIGLAADGRRADHGPTGVGSYESWMVTLTVHSGPVKVSWARPGSRPVNATNSRRGARARGAAKSSASAPA